MAVERGSNGQGAQGGGRHTKRYAMGGVHAGQGLVLAKVQFRFADSALFFASHLRTVSQSTGLSLGPFDLSQDFDDIESSIITVQTPNSPCDTATVTLVTQMDTSMIPDPCEIFYATPCYPRFEFYVDQIELIGYAAP